MENITQETLDFLIRIGNLCNEASDTIAELDGDSAIAKKLVEVLNACDLVADSVEELEDLVLKQKGM